MDFCHDSKVFSVKSDRVRIGNTVEDIKCDIVENLFCLQGRFPEVATKNDLYLALAYAVRNRLLHRWITTARAYFEQKSRTVAYLSAEFLMGPQLAKNLVNLGIYEETMRAVEDLGLSLDELIDQEAEPGLGNGGLGRLAACYMESMASQAIPAIGYGIRYEFGIFQQEIRDGRQVEMSDRWLRLGNPWEIPRPEITFPVKIGGRTEPFTDENGRYGVRWAPDRVVMGSPCDMPVLGYAVNNANFLRLWKAEAVQSFDFQAFNVGDYYRAVNEKVISENITKVLYPNDEPAVGKELRLEQQYFFISCSLQDMIRIYRQRQSDLSEFHEKYVIQLNDTHPAIAVPELMRLLVDEHRMDWEKAWHITSNTFAYTNHTLLPEALEKWPLQLFAHVLPRHLEIIYEINRRFLDEVRVLYPGDEGKIQRLSLIEEGGAKQVRMANVACVGSKAVNGVAALHTELLKETVLKDFYELWPEKFSNKTNGVTPRRFLALANPGLARLVSGRIGDAWIRDLDGLRRIEGCLEDAGFQEDWRRVKHANKQSLSEMIRESVGVRVNPESMFDVHVKRIHEYKRQHLNLLHVLTLYRRMKENPQMEVTPRTFIFGGKAAPGYFMAKLIIELVNSAADAINNDPAVRDRLKVVFFPNFGVKSGQHIYPAADLSEQISLAGKEASGTGNMKFSMNGALTIGTLDGANVEIREEVGAENFFLFGLTAEEVLRRKAEGYRPWELYRENAELRGVLEFIGSGALSRGDSSLFQPLVDSIVHHDEYMLCADYPSYIDCQTRVGLAYADEKYWTRMAILNVARMGKFSSDRAIKEYCRDIWQVEPSPVQLTE